eukprot:Plantae.Rhodophyta-Purpureofilum_apyrenoidigerum.ctg45297.p2 GENE.Plantae.Rhodophyta-Purpureofilum_apyrenoidigerum.ctg45297~~Plantae.Rhodophyta-Purpureofilum_apyrenoidigerum.ctg45297.p2  ORF type:complete len:271 (+),score=59.60 Plantae.Rhodophyta-Purpureofilum_apyrenoidigerum.ctg45297:159-971(+)
MGAMVANVDELLKKHQMDILELRTCLADVPLPPEYDDIRLLRYVLSYPKLGIASEQVRKGVKFRKENEDWLTAAWKGGSPPYESEVVQYCKMGVHGESNGMLYFYMRSGKAIRKLKELPAKELAPLCDRVTKFLTFVKEAIFAKCEEKTRKTRMLTKFVNIHTDMAEFPYWANMTFIKMFKETSLHSTFLHPQLMHKQVVLDPPRMFFYVWKIAKPLLPKKTVERMMFCPTAEFLGSIVNNLDPVVIPRVAGGNCKCADDDECLPGFNLC